MIDPISATAIILVDKFIERYELDKKFLQAIASLIGKTVGDTAKEKISNWIGLNKDLLQKQLEKIINQAKKQTKQKFAKQLKKSIFSLRKPFYSDPDFLALIIQWQFYKPDAQQQLKAEIENYINNKSDKIIILPEAVDFFIDKFIELLKENSKITDLRAKKDFHTIVLNTYLLLENFSQQNIDKLSQLIENSNNQIQLLNQIFLALQQNTLITDFKAFIEKHNDLIVKLDTLIQQANNYLFLQKQISEKLSDQEQTINHLLHSYFYLVKPVSEILPQHILQDRRLDAFLKNKQQYFERDFDKELFKLTEKQIQILLDDSRTQARAILIVGRPLAGKTTAVYNLLKKDILTDFILVKPKILTDLSSRFLDLIKLFPEKQTIVFLDDITNYGEQVYDFVEKLKGIALVIATIRTGEKEYAQFERQAKGETAFDKFFDIVEIPKITSDKQQIIEKFNITADQQKFFDGNIGTILLDLTEMQKRYDKLPENAKLLLKTFKALSFTHPLPQRIEQNNKQKIALASDYIPYVLMEQAAEFLFDIKEKNLKLAIEQTYDDKKHQNFIIAYLKENVLKTYNKFIDRLLTNKFNITLKTEYAYLNFIISYSGRKQENIFDILLNIDENLKARTFNKDQLLKIFPKTFLSKAITFYLLENLTLPLDNILRLFSDLDNTIFSYAITSHHLNVLLNNFYDQKEKIEKQFPRFGELMDVVSYSTLIAKSPDYNTAVEWFEIMKKQKLKPNEVSYNTLIAKSPDYNTAQKWLKQMSQKQLYPDAITLGTWIKKHKHNKKQAVQQFFDLFPPHKIKFHKFRKLKFPRQFADDYLLVANHTIYLGTKDGCRLASHLLNKYQQQANRLSAEYYNVLANWQKDCQHNISAALGNYETAINEYEDLEQTNASQKKHNSANINLAKYLNNYAYAVMLAGRQDLFPEAEQNLIRAIQLANKFIYAPVHYIILRLMQETGKSYEQVLAEITTQQDRIKDLHKQLQDKHNLQIGWQRLWNKLQDVAGEK